MARITSPHWEAHLQYDDDGYVCKAEEPLKPFKTLARDEDSVKETCLERGWNYEQKWMPDP